MSAVILSQRKFEFELLGPADFAGAQSQDFEFLARRGGTSRYLVKWMPYSEAALARARTLIDLDLRVPMLVLPRDLILERGRIGIVAPLVEATTSLESRLLSNPPTIRARAIYALQMAYATAVAQNNGIVHGDQHAQNWLAGDLAIYLIDWDNATGHGLPVATLAGGEYSAAPERFHAGHQPDAASEAYSLAACLHELLLGFNHLCNDEGWTTEQAREKPWQHDPARNRLSPGLPVDYLHPSLVQAFALTLQPDPAKRVPAARWWEALRRLVAEGRLAKCTACGMTLHLHSGRSSCAFCHCACRRGGAAG